MTADKEVVLTTYEIYQAACAGVMRQVEALRDGRNPTHGQSPVYNWRDHVEGAMAECALAKHLDLYWSGKGEIFGKDIGDIEVRWSEEPGNRLIIHKKDRDNSKFFLLTGANGKYTIRGWIYGHEGKRDHYWCDPTGKNRPAYFIGQNKLSKEY